MNEQEISIEVDEINYGTRSVTLLGLNSDFIRASLRTNEEGSRYTLTAKPLDVNAAVDAIAILEVQGDDGTKIQTPVRLLVK
jgi:hypothetical protein